MAQEDERQPLSDHEIARRLRRAGFDVARRTVTKYRRMLKIPARLHRRGEKNSSSLLIQTTASRY
ncbi:MAG: hypothetical protein NZT92_07255 [Abditibacteriales bacterium]|nr:hypothetical protein [Abditibacteriales bacterium]